MAKKYSHARKRTWLAPLAFALPVLALMAAALIIWGDKIRDLINIAVKLAVIS